MLRPEWQELFEGFSDRFVIGTDIVDPNRPFVQEYESLIMYWREIIGQLSRDTAERIAHQNAERILRLPPSTK
jgi:predicted TIM-barrel fold metal-dependent hydrolase